jgi:hypothetical protein
MGKPDGGDRRLGRTVAHGLAISLLRLVKRKCHNQWPGSSLTVLE